MYRPGRRSVTKCARASSASSGRTRPGDSPARLGTAPAPTSEPGCSPSSRKSRAASELSVRYDQENTARTSVTASPPSNASKPPRRSEEHTSELQSRGHLVCRLLLEKKKPTSTRRLDSQYKNKK